MAKGSGYLTQFFRDRKEVGAVAPSSKSLGRKICSFIDFDSSNVIVELGPGNGVFTKLLLERMNPDSKLIVFETNKTFCDMIATSIKDDRLVIINDSAEKVGKVAADLEITDVDNIISSLPYTVFPKEVKNKILDECASILKPDGLYLQFQYSLNALRLLKSKFNKVTYTFSLLNFPPAFVYRCQNLPESKNN